MLWACCSLFFPRLKPWIVILLNHLNLQKAQRKLHTLTVRRNPMLLEKVKADPKTITQHFILHF